MSRYDDQQTALRANGLMLVGITCGAALGAGLGVLVWIVSGDSGWGLAAGFAVAIPSVMAGLCYCQLFSEVETWIHRPERNEKSEFKFQTIELRLGALYGLAAGIAASQVVLPEAAIWTIAAAMAVVGGIIGHDFRRRVDLIRAQKARADAVTPARSSQQTESV